MAFWEFREYVPVAARKEKAKKKLEKLRKKNPDINPIIIQGQNIASTWWGKAWNKNLEKYADFSNRIGRGRSYVRHGSVLDLQISKGKIKALVLGSQSTPYKVTIEIKSLQKNRWKNIKKECEGKFDSLHQLLEGKFPKELTEIFTDKNTGLFPSSSEITFSCSCPDWAYMCKHVAAALFGIGARLDQAPELFFTLRDIEINKLIKQAVKDKKLSFLEKAKKKSERVLSDSNLSSLFGIDMDEMDSLNGLIKGKNFPDKPAKKIRIKKSIGKKEEKNKQESKKSREKKSKVKIIDTKKSSSKKVKIKK